MTQTANEWEKDWWGTCQNTFGEEEKQLIYAKKMGIEFTHDGKSPYNIDLKGKSVLDIGGGPSSLLLKCVNAGKCAVLDPLPVPGWVVERYSIAGISVLQGKAEEVVVGGFDEVWIYNVLQHVECPEAVVARALNSGASIIRIFEWIGTPTNIGHPNSLSEEELNKWLNGKGTVEILDTTTLKGKCYYGVFDVKCKSTDIAPESAKVIPALKQPDHFRFHYPGLVHLPISERYMACAFTQKIVKLSKMLLSLGHEVCLYGAESSDAPCTEFVQTHTMQDIRDSWGEGDSRFELGYDWRNKGFKHDFNTARTPATMKFYAACAVEINKRKRPDDFLLLSQGSYHRPIAEAGKLFLTCEPGVGYRGSYAEYRAFESAYIMNFTYGSEHPRESINGHYYDRVIPNYFDPKDFEYTDKKADYFLFVGRVILRKGVWTAIKATEAIGARLIIAGQQDSEIDIGRLPKHCEFVGYVDPPVRTQLMKCARALFVPTIYLEPFAGVHAEAMLCGTPVITTNFGVFPETVVNGVNGFRCDTLQDFVDAAKRVGELAPNTIRLHGERFLMDNVKKEYEKWFRDLYQLYLSAAHPHVNGWHHLE